MNRTVHLSRSGIVAVPAAQAFDRLLPIRLSELYSSWYGALPPVRHTVQDGVWGTPGQRRTLVFAGPGDVEQTLVEVDRPHGFRYELSAPTGPLGLLVARVHGAWTVADTPAGTRLTWSWAVEPRHRAAAAAMPVFAFFWRGYARAALARLDTLLT